ncbi:septum formation family protein [Phytohabitans rumicis]|uniref:Septum formation-related domain-containing protein n=1 Tax=Phytohabitans rumicis TaxID=1076125 RepID=A0A6V8KVZ2_9ACTN|nr:septum formation family protein [Phytohabitans rumicis]GFJ88004.1 hypothetical protein Prum_016460 [Phytohabitans rumicis]
MRGWLRAVLLGGLITALLTGCNPAGVDGSLTDDWKAVPEPAPFVPATGVCHAGTRPVTRTSLGLYLPLDCAGEHGFETIHVGQFTGADASSATAPELGSPAVEAAFAQCDAKAEEYLGGDWRAARLNLHLLLPSLQTWDGGGRWFRCDLSEIDAIHSAETQARSGPLRDVLKAASPLAYNCFKVVLSADERQVSQMNQVACTKAHRTEFVGIWTAPDTSHADFVKNQKGAEAGCQKLMAAYVKAPNDSALASRFTTIFYYPIEERWKAGDRGVQCFLWVYGKEATRSLKG